ncbi:MAG: hypothetical protein HQL53_09275 [Magnetococcales bacterium]|nr:hypothetical protein [Magnetococcales bacterium]
MLEMQSAGAYSSSRRATTKLTAAVYVGGAYGLIMLSMMYAFDVFSWI